MSLGLRAGRAHAMSEQNDHDLLVRIDERVARIDRCLTAHLNRHWAASLAAAGAFLTAVLSLAIALGTR